MNGDAVGAWRWAIAWGTLLLWASEAAAQQINYEAGQVLPSSASIIDIGGYTFAPGPEVRLTPAVHLEATGQGTSWLWWVLDPTSRVLPVVTGENGKQALFFPVRDGKHLVMLATWMNNHFIQSSQYITIGIPDPDPDPDPGPDPEPVASLWGMVIEETAQRSAAEAAIITSMRIKEAFPAGQWHVWDQDIKDPNGRTPTSLAKWIELAQQRGLPTLFLYDGDGNILYKGPLPQNVAATLELINKYKLAPSKPARVSTRTVTRPTYRLYCDPRTGSCSWVLAP